MRRLRGGDAHAIEELYREYHPRLLSFCRHMLGNPEEAEDAVQLTFLAAHVQLPHERIETSVGAWLFTVARRKCIDILRRRRTNVELRDDDAISVAGLASQVEQREDLRRLVADLQRLDTAHRAALVLTQLEALPQAQVAEVLGTHEARVRRLVFEARQSLLARRESRNLACRAVQEELANARGSQFRRRHLVAHCEECEDCEAYRTALLGQRTALRVVLPAVPLLFSARKAWASASVPRPHVSLPRRFVDAVARVPAPALGTMVVVATMSVAGGLPSRTTAPAPAPAPAPFSADSANDTKPSRAARASPAVTLQRRRAPRARARLRVISTPLASAAIADPASAPRPAERPSSHPPQGDSGRSTPEPPPTPAIAPGAAETPAVTVPTVTLPTETIPSVTVTVPTVTVPATGDDDRCTGDNNGNGNGEGCTPNGDPNGPPRDDQGGGGLPP